MVGLIISIALVAVLWGAFTASISAFPFLAPYGVYVNWAAGILGGILLVALIACIVKKIMRG